MKRLMIAALALCLAAPAVADDTGRWSYITTSRMTDQTKDWSNPPRGHTAGPYPVRFASYKECKVALEAFLAAWNSPNSVTWQNGVTKEGLCVVAHHLKEAY